MKELHLFYAPDAQTSNRLPDDEAAHAVRVLRMQAGDSLYLTDGKGFFYEAQITQTSQKACFFSILKQVAWTPHWKGHIEVAVAPTKNMDRMEWYAEKAVEIGCDKLAFLLCKNSERQVLKKERIEKIAVSAMKQSHKGVLPKVESLVRFNDYISRPFDGLRCIAHCYADADTGVAKKLLYDVAGKGHDIQVLVGPEGDFSIDEVRQAIARGFIPVSLGESRLRTETAALVAVHTANLKMSL